MLQRIKDFFDITTRREKTRGTLWASIQARRVIEFYYHGSYRIVEPYALGITRPGEADNESLICYQLSGFSDLNDTMGWKLYRASEMEDIRVSQEQFTGDRPGYDPDNINMAQIFCCVRPDSPSVIEVKEAPRPDHAAVWKPAPPPLTHNELVRRFRFTHSLHSTEPSPSAQRLPERVKSKI